MSLADLLGELEAAKDPEKAGPMEAYMRYQFPFLGIAGPERNALYRKYFLSAKKTKMIDWDFVDTCWEKEPREYQYVAANYLKAMQSYLTKDDLPKLERLVVTKSWWDTVDILDRVVGSLVANHPELEEVILKWSLSDNIWLRRVAIDHQLLRKEKTNVQLMEKILVNNLDQTEFFINKAIGWALRDYSKTNPEWVARFIEQNKKRMSELSIREASKYL
ncbi:DNA alkylation repair protein [Streptococcus sp. HMSC066F01]|uniref:DNA alkylation repair protein n=1 Tax=Streptococcus TaxID=1301 RepID=UPI0008A9321F|nr:DNA alkylation repair protein [Streptococcus sp. HMSC066F01]MBS9406816.1 DNA alkylation repair protein [Streptococcus oralis]OHQ21653.1 DNA alkylation repair protein [Streptococcus sp. HMSC066F01]